VSAYVEECRREWRRLGVPELLADEMATDLEADLAEAQADGVSAAEILGESDPRRFAESWASERGLVSEQPPRKRGRKRFWIALAVILVFVGFLLGVAGVALFAKPTVHASGPPPVRATGIPDLRSVPVPDLVGLQACQAVRIATRAGIEVIPHQPGDLPKDAVVDGKGYSCDAVVVRQRPAPEQDVQHPRRLSLWLGPASGG
jgi:hypothetical protein